MTLAEHRRVVEITVEQTAGRVPVVAGAASNDTKKAIALSREMKAAGATHLLHASPMYNKPPQRGIVAHFRAIADSVDPGLCPPACSRSCAERCGDLATRVGDFVPCQEVCSRSCVDLEATYGVSHELCTYLVENRFDPTYVTAPDR